MKRGVFLVILACMTKVTLATEESQLRGSSLERGNDASLSFKLKSGSRKITKAWSDKKANGMLDLGKPAIEEVHTNDGTAHLDKSTGENSNANMKEELQDELGPINDKMSKISNKDQQLKKHDILSFSTSDDFVAIHQRDLKAVPEKEMKRNLFWKCEAFVCCSDSDCSEGQMCKTFKWFPHKNKCECSLAEVECCSDSDCSDGQTCQLGNNKCECSLEKVECCSDSDCSEWQTCQLGNNKCECSLEKVECCSDSDCSEGQICQVGNPFLNNACVCDPESPTSDCCLESSDCITMLNRTLTGNATLDEFQAFFQKFIWNDYLSLLENVTINEPHPFSSDIGMLSRRVFLYMNGKLPLLPLDLDATAFTNRTKSRSLVASSQMTTTRSERHLDLTEDCKVAILKLAGSILSAILATFGLPKVTGQKFFEILFLRNKVLVEKVIPIMLKPIGGAVTEEIDSVVSLVMLIFTTVPWSEIDEAGRVAFGWRDLIKFLLNLTLIITSMAAGPTSTALLVAKVSLLSVAIIDLINGFLAVNQACVKDVTVVGEDCNGYYQSGGQGTSFYIIDLKSSKGVFTLSYQMFANPDKLVTIYEDKVLFTTNGLVSGSRDVQLSIDGTSEQLDVTITAPNPGTEWNFALTCPCNLDLPWVDCCGQDDCSAGRTCAWNNKCSCDVSLPGVDCCDHGDCAKLGDGAICVAEKCCKKDVNSGITCCRDIDCDSSSICIENQCRCSRLRPGVECCEDSDCFFEFQTCDVESHRCMGSPQCDLNVVECCVDSECYHDWKTEVCQYNTCVPKGEVRFTLFWMGDADTLKLYVEDSLGREVVLGDPKSDANFGFLWDNICSLTSKTVSSDVYGLENGQVKSIAYTNWHHVKNGPDYYDFRVGAEAGFENSKWAVSVFWQENLHMTADGEGDSETYTVCVGWCD